MKYNIEMEEVLDLWQNVSKDPEYISKDMGITLEKVHVILNELSNRGDIKDYEEKIVRFDEMYLDDETRKKLDLERLQGFKHLYDVYFGDGFEIHLISMVKSKDMVSIFFSISTDYVLPVVIRMVYTPDDNVWFIGPGLEDGDHEECKRMLDHIKNLGKEKKFHILTNKILSDLLPSDYWSLKNISYN
ncbi:hypothetical protein EBU94_03075 [bacterium]|nr:hypothetical protein [bacterium]